MSAGPGDRAPCVLNHYYYYPPPTSCERALSSASSKRSSLDMSVRPQPSQQIMNREQPRTSAKDVAGCWCTAGLFCEASVCLCGTGPGCVIPKTDSSTDEAVDYYTTVCGVCAGGDSAAAGALPAFWACHQVYFRSADGWVPSDDSDASLCSMCKSMRWWGGATDNEMTTKACNNGCIVQFLECGKCCPCRPSCAVPTNCSCKVLPSC